MKLNVFKLKGMRRFIAALMESGFYLTLTLRERKDLAKRLFLAQFDVEPNKQ